MTLILSRPRARRCWLAAALLAWMYIGGSELPAASVRYRATDLKALGMDTASALNNLGHVVGGNSEASELLLFNGASVVSLGNHGYEYFAPFSINDSDQIVGSYYISTIPVTGDSRLRPFLEDHGTFTDLGLVFGYVKGRAMDINDYGEITGLSEVVEGNVGWAGWFVADGVATNLGGLDPQWTDTEPLGINNSGWITGNTAKDIDPGPVEEVVTRAFLWRDGEMRDLGTFGGENSMASDINDAGAVLGKAAYGVNYPVRLFVHSAGRMVPLPTLWDDPIADSNYQPSAINNYGVAVGTSGLYFVWSGGVMKTFDASLVDLSGTAMTIVGNPQAINDRGQILAYGTDGLYHSGPILLTPIPPTIPTRLVNVSARAATRTGDDTLILGFVNAGGENRVLARAVGPGMLDYNVPGAATDPRLDLYRNDLAGPISGSDHWGDGSDPAGVAATASRVGAFALDTGSTDAALVETVAARAYTMHANAATPSGGGIVLAEIYEARDADTTGRLVNASLRMWVGTGDEIGIMGFFLDGEYPARVLIRAVGPGLADYNVAGALANPQLFVYRGQDPTLGNDNWGTARGFPLLASITASAGAFALEDGSTDAALPLELEPGGYTVHVSGADGGTGVALVEVYLLEQ